METVGLAPEFWRNRRVLVTGHTGFKGSWLTAWLVQMGAHVRGFALRPTTSPNLWNMLELDEAAPSVYADINDRDALGQALRDHAPEIVFHFAAQSLVRRSYAAPEETFATNVVGTVTLLHQIAQTSSVRAVVIATSDKCYEVTDLPRGFREDDRFGGRDPYSASKGCTEIAASAMRQSFFAPYAPRGHPARIATVRAGNVIGGGDWSDDRLIPDIVRGCLGDEGRVEIRAPRSIRPWQHVLEPLRGYLALAQQLHTDQGKLDRGWNFGPQQVDERPVLEVADTFCRALGRGRVVVAEQPGALHETGVLRLDISAVGMELGWKPLLTFDETIEMTAEWYRQWASGDDPRKLIRSQIDAYVEKIALVV